MKYLPQLFANNREWVAERTARDPRFFERHVEQQAPPHLWIGCADSRVPANEIVGLDPGELFVHRNVANLIPPDDPNAQAVLQFAVNSLKVEHVIVCGHYRCGGVQAALGKPLDDHLETWVGHIRQVRAHREAELSAISDDDARWERLCELNVIAQVASLARNPVVTGAWTRGQSLVLHGWMYDIGTGFLTDLDVSLAAPRPA